MRKELVNCLWFGQHMKPPLHTRKGEEIEIFSPGYWNTIEADPDFDHAEIVQENGDLMKCNIYTEVNLSDINTDLIVDDAPLIVVMYDDTRKEFNEPIIVLEDNMGEEMVETFTELF